MLKPQNKSIPGSSVKCSNNVSKVLTEERLAQDSQLKENNVINLMEINRKEKVFTYLCLTAVNGSVIFQMCFSDKFPDTAQIS